MRLNGSKPRAEVEGVRDEIRCPFCHKYNTTRASDEEKALLIYAAFVTRKHGPREIYCYCELKK